MQGEWRHGRGRVNLWGILLVVVGAWWLLGELGYVRFEWVWVGPLAIILVGVSMLLRGSAWGGRYCDCGGGHEHGHGHEPPKTM